MRDEKQKKEMSEVFNGQNLEECVSEEQLQTSDIVESESIEIANTDVEIAENEESNHTEEDSVRGEESEDMDEGSTEDEEFDVPPVRERTEKEKAYDWLYEHHVTVRVMDAVLAVCIIALIIIVVLGMMKGN